MQPMSTQFRHAFNDYLVVIARLLFALVFLVAVSVSVQQPALAVSPPTISPRSGLYFPGPSVTITASGGTIYYTVDGSLPTTSSPVYSSSLTINNTTTVNSIVVQSGVASSVATQTYVVDPTTYPVQKFGANTLYMWLRSDVGVTASSGNVSSWADSSGVGFPSNGNIATQSISGNQPSLETNAFNGYPAITTSTNKYFNLPSDFSGMTSYGLYFVTKPTGTSNGVLLDLSNGSSSDELSTSSAGTSAAITLNGSAVTASSALTSDQYQLLGIEHDSGTSSIFTNNVLQNSGSQSSYGLGGSVNHIGTDYSTSSNFYNGSFLEMLVYQSHGAPVYLYLLSRYQLLSVVPSPPVISVATGTLSGPTQVAIATPPDCICRYTVNGTTPSSTSPIYSGPINVFFTQTLKAVAFKNSISSTVSSATYTLDSTQWPAPDPSDSTPLQVNVQAPN